MFVLQAGSRNAFNQQRLENEFQENCTKLFGLRMPHMDTVHEVLSRLKESELESLKGRLLKVLLQNKVFHKWRLFGRWFIIVVDGTGVHSFKDSSMEGCVKRARKVFELTESGLTALGQALTAEQTALLKPLVGQIFQGHKAFSKALKARLGKAALNQHRAVIDEQVSCQETSVSYHRPVLEAKLAGANGFSVSLATEWIENTEADYNKQDCELSAFKRLAKKLKQAFPRLPVCIVADGLYPNEPFFEVCRNHGWEFLCVLQDGNLPSVQEEVESLRKLTKNNTRAEAFRPPEGCRVERAYTWINDIGYQRSTLHWLECVETTQQENEEDKSVRFVWVSSIKVSVENAKTLSNAGRLRQKIENEGFNTQKNSGYNLEHKYSRKSQQASKNYYQCLQIAHLINQLMLLSSFMQQQFKIWETTWKHGWTALRAFLMEGRVDSGELETLLQQKVQYRYLQ